MGHPSSPENSTRSLGRVLFFVMLAIIVGFIAAFLILRPNPTGGGGSATPTSQH